MKPKYLQVGPYTAIGGVSVHIKRLSELLAEHYSFSFIDESPLIGTNREVYNLREINIFEYIRLVNNTHIIHVHSGIWWLRCLHILVGFLFRKKTIVTIHSLSNLTTGFSVIITRFFLLFASKIIVVNKEISRKIKNKKCNVVHAFIPPNIENEKNLPKEVLDILEQNRHKKIIVNNAFKLVFHNNEDLYGLDLIIDVARAVKTEKKNYKIIFVVTSKEEKLNLYEHYSRIIMEEGLNEIISIIPYPLSFVRLMIESDLVIRSTNTDGDALTVREAIYLNRPVIASDVISRPKGTILFQNRNSENLFVKIKDTLNKEKKTNSKTQTNNRNAIIERYRLLISK